MLFDTRYFLAVLTSTDEHERERLKGIYDRSKAAYASAVTVYELYKALIGTQGREAARLQTESLEKDFNIVDVDAETAKDGAELSHRLRIPMGDALILATAKRLRLPCVTDDPHFTEVKAVWP